jgi:hypothetical protein
MRATRVAALGVAVAASLVTPAVASIDVGEVTIRVRMFVDRGTMTRKLDVSGTIANPAAGETVNVEAKECGPNHRFYRVVAGTRTVAGGAWDLDPVRAGVQLYTLPLNAYFRARWRTFVSEPVLVRLPMFVSASWNPRRRVVNVSVSTGLGGQDVRGRFVELQRKVEGTDQWLRVRRARLGRGTYEGYFGRRFKARFSVPTRGLTLRVFAPDATGAPCFSSGFSASFES